MLPRNFASNLAIIAAILSIHACSSAPAQPELAPMVLAPYAEPTDTPYIPRSPTATPRRTPTDTPNPPAPSRVNLPPLEDIRGSVITSGLGGGPLCDDYYQGPPKVFGAANSWVPARTGYVCLYGLNFDTNFHIELTAPDGSTTLGGDYFVSSQDFDVAWNGFNLRNYGSYANWLQGVDPGAIHIMGEVYTRIFINTRWRGDLPDGNWRIRILAENTEIVGEFYAIAPEYPSLTVLDSHWDWIKPAYSHCFLANKPQDLSVLAEGYPANRDVYVYIYEQNDGLVLERTFMTDSGGSFYQSIPGPYHQDGRYFVIGAFEPLSGADIPQGNLVDCFYVP